MTKEKTTDVEKQVKTATKQVENKRDAVNLDKKKSTRVAVKAVDKTTKSVKPDDQKSVNDQKSIKVDNKTNAKPEKTVAKSDVKKVNIDSKKVNTDSKNAGAKSKNTSNLQRNNNLQKNNNAARAEVDAKNSGAKKYNYGLQQRMKKVALLATSMQKYGNDFAGENEEIEDKNVAETASENAGNVGENKEIAGKDNLKNVANKPSSKSRMKVVAQDKEDVKATEKKDFKCNDSLEKSFDLNKNVGENFLSDDEKIIKKVRYVKENIAHNCSYDNNKNKTREKIGNAHSNMLKSKNGLNDAKDNVFVNAGNNCSEKKAHEKNEISKINKEDAYEEKAKNTKMNFNPQNSCKSAIVDLNSDEFIPQKSDLVDTFLKGEFAVIQNDVKNSAKANGTKENNEQENSAKKIKIDVINSPENSKHPSKNSHSNTSKMPIQSQLQPEVENRRCGYMSIVGETNSGKSTLINKLVGSKVSIVSRKVQTTNTRILGVVINENSQIILIDTPGFNTHNHASKFNKIAWDAFRETEYVLFVCDVAKRELDYTYELIQKIDEGKKIILVLNKIDLIYKERLLEIITKFDSIKKFEKVFLVSALNGSGVNDLSDYIAGLVPQADWVYKDDVTVDMPFAEYVAEITREHLYHRIHKEIPYQSNVKTDQYEQQKDGSIRIVQTIFANNQQHKIILIGSHGGKIKAIGEAARLELEELLEKRVHLFLRVVVADKHKAV